MQHYFLIVMILFISVTSAHSDDQTTFIHWLEDTPMVLETVELKSCPALVQRIASVQREFSVVYAHNPEDTFDIRMLSYDLNGDGVRDYWMTYHAAAYCGSAGCSTDLFVSNGQADDCTLIAHPSYQHRLGAGDDGQIYFFHKGFFKQGGGRCATLSQWSLVENRQIVHKWNYQCLPGL